METIRAFIAVKLSPEIRDSLKDLQTQLRHRDLDVKWVEPENIHLTMKFLGDIRADKIEEIKGALAEAVSGCGRFDISLAGTGVFPDRKRPRVIWAGIRDGSETLVKLAGRIEECMEICGFQRDDRGFTAHITIARVKEMHFPQQFFETAEKLKDREFGRMTVKKISLIKSTLTQKGPIYDTICKTEFRG